MALKLPSRVDVLRWLAEKGEPVRAQELASWFRVEPEGLPGFIRLLDSLTYEGTLVAFPRERYGVASIKRVVRDEMEGALVVNPRGFGFVHAEEGGEDVFINESDMAGALHGDKVRVVLLRRTSQGPAGRVVAILERGMTQATGIFRKRGASAWVEPDDPRMRGPIVLTGPLPVDAEDGQAVVIRVTRYPELAAEHPQGELLQVLGTPGEPRVEVQKILHRHQVTEEHPVAAEQEALAFGHEVAEGALLGRVDLTGIPLPTIDPIDARDHDDAVWVERREDGSFEATIAIADVSHYVRPGTALDAAALSRGCSIYLPDRAIPMLPRALSSNLCSLLPEVTRLCMAVVVQLDAGAHVTSLRVFEGFMRSQAKLNYEGVAAALGFSSSTPQPEAMPLLEGLKAADVLARMLRSKRLKRGSVDLHVPEAKIELDPKTAAPIGITRRAQDPGVKRAYEMIEELMLLANEAVAHALLVHQKPTVFRVHPPPDDAKLEIFAQLCERMGVSFDAAEGRDPKRLSQFAQRVASLERGPLMHMLLLRSMKQAFYDPKNIGHFGLASPEYVHFTSPIRRYPDLIVHRGLKEILRAAAESGRLVNGGVELSWARPATLWGKSTVGQEETSEVSLPLKRSTLKGKKAPALKDPVAPMDQALQHAAVEASKLERRAMDVEREVVDLHRALYMRQFVGQTFEGTVVSMFAGGATVQLDEPLVDVLVRPDAMGKDAYTLNEELMMFVAARSGDRVALGDRMAVTIEDVSIEKRLVLGWRLAPNLADVDPLRQSPFGLREMVARRRKKDPAVRAPEPRGKLKASRPKKLGKVAAKARKGKK